MKAMILAAGKGTRLKPLTDSRPKALVEINGTTLLELVLCRLVEAGVTEAIINLHHFG
jgi:NDP-sugar pyrophosphorylase family protein